jgi:hypothetical protein
VGAAGGGAVAHDAEVVVGVEQHVGHVLGRRGVLGDILGVAGAVDLEAAALDGEDLGLGAGEVVGVAGVELGAVLLGGAREELDGDARAAEGGLEAVLPEGLELELTG